MDDATALMEIEAIKQLKARCCRYLDTKDWTRRHLQRVRLRVSVGSDQEGDAPSAEMTNHDVLT
jgi:hypothetical protein